MVNSDHHENSVTDLQARAPHGGMADIGNGAGIPEILEVWGKRYAVSDVSEIVDFEHGFIGAQRRRISIGLDQVV